MKLYLDMCAWKRPFDDQSDDRIWMESLAVIRILDLARAGNIRIMTSRALVLENNRNPKALRRMRVSALLNAYSGPMEVSNSTLTRAMHLRAKGFDDMDALHLAFAESLGADYFVTCDDSIISFKRKVGVKVISPVDFLKENAT